MSGKILVIGATGAVGRGIVRTLQTYGKFVRAATRMPIPYAVAHPDLEVVLFDYRDPATFAPSVEGISQAFVMPQPYDPAPQNSVIPLIEAAEKAGVEHIVLMSHLDAPLSANSGLLEVEDYLINSDIEHTVLRPNWLMQMFNPGFLWPMIRKTDSIFLPAGKAEISFIDGNDVSDVATVALTEEGHRNKIYTLTGCEALSCCDVAKIMTNAGSRKVQYVQVSDHDFYQTLISMEMNPDRVTDLVGRFALIRQGCTKVVTGEVERLLGRRPGRFLDYAYDHARIWGGHR